MPDLPEVGAGRRLQQISGIEAALSSTPSVSDEQQAVFTAAAADAASSSGCKDSSGCFTPRGGFFGMDAPPVGTMGLAVGRHHLVQAAGGVMTVYNLSPTGARGAAVKAVSLRSFFAGVAPSCDSANDAAVMYDKHADRFVVAASCGGFGRLLLGATATPSAAGTWFLYGLIADAVGTQLECRSPKEQALVDYPQLGYNKDGLFLSYYSFCPSRPEVSGASLLAIPKYKAYQGAPSMYYAVYTAAEVAAAAGLPGGAAAVRQLQPVVPQAPGDVQEGVAYFVSDHLPLGGSQRSSFTLVALANTGALWGYAAEVNGVPSPSLTATTVPWGKKVPIFDQARLRQPAGGSELDAGGNRPVGFWSGGAALSRGKLMLTSRADVTEDGGLYSPRPGVIWAEVEPSLDWNPASGSANSTSFLVDASDCPAAVASGMPATFDWSKDFSLTWGSEFARNWSWSLGMFKAASAIKTRTTVPRTRSAAVVLDRSVRLAQAAATSPAANFINMAFPQAAATGGGFWSSLLGRSGPNGGGGYQGRSGNCGCQSSCGWGELNSYNYVYSFDDYCDAGSNQWGPESGNDMWGTTYNGAYCTGDATFGLVGNHQYDQCGRFCEVRCPGGPGGYGGISSYSSPRYNYYGATNYYPGFGYASIPTNATAPATEAAAAAAPVAQAPLLPTRPMQAAACASAAGLSARLLRRGSLDPGAPLGLAFPSVAVAPNGAAVVGVVYSGPGKLPDGGFDAFPGVGVAVVDAAASGAVPMSTLQRGTGLVEPSRAGNGVSWGELSAADVHPVTGAVYVAARRGGLTRTGRGHVATWVAVMPMTATR